jgi:hypothetical protein
MKIQNDARMNLNRFAFLNVSSRVENAFSNLRMPFRRFYECLHLELEMLPTILRMLFRRIECASHALRMLFRGIENASHALRMLFGELKMLLTL